MLEKENGTCFSDVLAALLVSYQNNNFPESRLIPFWFLPILFELASEMSLLSHQHPPERPYEF